jgi:hypothetical protein
MAATNNRTTADVRREIATERDQLADAVEDLRTGHLPVVAAGALGAGFVVAGGIGAMMRLLFRRGREGEEKARLGPFAFIDRR